MQLYALLRGVRDLQDRGHPLAPTRFRRLAALFMIAAATGPLARLAGWEWWFQPLR
ncbi:hypothetical protein [Sphingomonas sp. 1P08PE]|uniref:hypothetical protein n=1 Tax=Sphingomonas sp. 1P08PE TaxID=554122 RepID=UPI0039A090D7